MSTSTSPAGTLLRSLIGRLVGFGVGVALLVGGYLLLVSSERPSAPGVGACVDVTGTASDADIEVLDCAEPDATYRVTGSPGSPGSDGSCDEAELTYAARAGGGAGDVRLCLTYNAEPGDCFAIAAAGADQKVACRGAGANVRRVLAVAQDAEAACPRATTLEVPNATRDSLVCFGDVG